MIGRLQPFFMFLLLWISLLAAFPASKTQLLRSNRIFTKYYEGNLHHLPLLGTKLIRRTSISLQSSTPDDVSDLSPNSIEEDVSRILEMYFQAEGTADGIRSVNPSILLENAPFLAKGRIYEQVLKKKMDQLRSNDDIVRLGNVDSFIRGFVLSERKSRARLKVNYIMAGATSNRLDESIELLYNTEEIDEDLLLYINSLINKQLVRSGGPTAESEDDLEPDSTGSKTIQVLRLIYKRLEAQMKTQGKMELILLAKLMSEEDAAAREKILRSQLVKVEDMDGFANFVRSGIDHMTAVSSQGKEVSVGKIERMKDILISANELLQFFNDQDTVMDTRKSSFE